VLRHLLALPLALCGCSTVRLDDEGVSRWYVGVVRVVLPDSRGKLAAVDVKSLGVGWDAGPYLGWRSGNWIIADPADCQLLVVIRSPAQAANAAAVLKSLEGTQACIADYTHSLPR
jgi:hypothetical protein